MTAFHIGRDIEIAAPADRIHALIDDLREWTRWSPWEGVDPDLKRTYSGPASGPEAKYAWEGDRKAGAGSMEIVSSATDRICLTLEFRRPFKAVNQVEFRLEPTGDRTTVTWVMSGERGTVASLAARVLPMDAMIGKDFDKCLRQLRAVAEGR